MDIKGTFSSFSVKDIEEAKQFYSETLGIEVESIPEGLDLKLPNNSVFIYPKPNHEPATFTVLNFLVDVVSLYIQFQFTGKVTGNTKIHVVSVQIVSRHDAV